jgi:hypothetical protein
VNYELKTYVPSIRADVTLTLLLGEFYAVIRRECFKCCIITIKNHVLNPWWHMLIEKKLYRTDICFLHVTSLFQLDTECVIQVRVNIFAKSPKITRIIKFVLVILGRSSLHC